MGFTGYRIGGNKMSKESRQQAIRKWTSRKFILCMLWLALLTYCCVRDGDMISSGFCMVLAITGAIVNGVYVLGAFAKDITTIRFGHKDTTVELTMKPKE